MSSKKKNSVIKNYNSNTNAKSSGVIREDKSKTINKLQSDITFKDMLRSSNECHANSFKVSKYI